MATTTRAVLRQQMSKEIRDDRQLSLTSNGNAGGTTIVDTKLAQYSGGDDDFCLDWYVIVTSGDASGEIKKVSAYTESSNTITVNSAFSAQIVSAVTYELHQFDPTVKHDALNLAIDDVFPDIYLPIRDETLVIDDRLSNSDFETFASGSFTGWTLAGAGAADDQETTIVFHGSSSAKVTSAAATATLSQTLNLNVWEVIGQAYVFRCFAHCADADTVRIRVSFDGGTTFDSSEFHSGGGDSDTPNWEELSVEGTVPSTATTFTVYLEVATGTKIGYFDAAYLFVGTHINKYTVPTTFPAFPHSVKMLDYPLEMGTDAVWKPLSDVNYPRSGARLLLEGMNVLTTMSTDASTIEIGEPQNRAVIALALHIMFRGNMSSGEAAARDMQRDQFLMDYWLSEYTRRINKPGVRMIPPPVYNRDGVWATGEDASGKYIQLVDARV